MGQSALNLPMSAEDFLAWDRTQTARHEFVRGEVFLMAGVEDRHATVSGNLYIALRTHLRGTPCRTFATDVKLRAAADCYFYPDVFVTCGPLDAASKYIKEEATLVVEVLSPGTAGNDRGLKFAAYRQLATLTEYVLVDVDTRRTDVYRKGGNGLWVLHPFEGAQAVRLESVALDVPAAELFAEIDLPAAGQG